MEWGEPPIATVTHYAPLYMQSLRLKLLNTECAATCAVGLVVTMKAEANQSQSVHIIILRHTAMPTSHPIVSLDTQSHVILLVYTSIES